MCGYPHITLRGTTQDWAKLRQKFHKLKDMNKDNSLDLNWWLEPLTPVIEEVCNTGINQKVDTDFWKDIYRKTTSKAYEPDHIEGWINAFIPYLNLDKSTSKGKRKGKVQGQFIRNEWVDWKKIKEG